VVNRKGIIWAVLGAAILWGLWYAFPTRERQVKRQLKSLAGWVSKEKDEGALAMAQRVGEANRYFAPSCTWKAEGYNLSGRFTPEDISRMAFAARSRADHVSLKLYDVHVDFPAKDTAHVDATARLSGESKSGDAINETHEVECVLKKTDGRWLLEEVTVVQVLER
jgi:ketosteroid isomerase-like protein